MRTFHVRAKRWARGYELLIQNEDGDHVGVTQSISRDDAEQMVRDYVVKTDCLDADDKGRFAVEITYVEDA